jgi:prepilin-type N-terminal cleavage/methylation domain-containing protein
MRKKQKGTSLIEVLVTLVIIAMGVAALVRFQNYLSYHSDLTQQKGDALSLAVNQIESLRNFQYINTTAGFAAYQDIASGNSTATIGNTTFAVTWAVTTNTSPAYKTINVSVSWTDRYANTNSINLVSNIAEVNPSTAASVM